MVARLSRATIGFVKFLQARHQQGEDLVPGCAGFAIELTRRFLGQVVRVQGLFEKAPTAALEVARDRRAVVRQVVAREAHQLGLVRGRHIGGVEEPHAPCRAPFGPDHPEPQQFIEHRARMDVAGHRCDQFLEARPRRIALPQQHP